MLITWSPLFFGLHSAALGMVESALLWMTLLAKVLVCWGIRRAADLPLPPGLRHLRCRAEPGPLAV